MYLQFSGNQFYGYVILIISGIITGISKSTNHKMPRSTYFLNTSLITLLLGASQILWLGAMQAVVSGTFYIIAVFDIIILFGAGFLYTMLAKARSNDAVGDASMTALAFIPLANLYLLFKPSKFKETEKSSSITTGASAVIIGIVALFLGRGAAVAIEQIAQQEVANVINSQNAVVVGTKYFEFYTRRDGLTAGLEHLASLEETGTVDEITNLSSVDVVGQSMIYNFQITDLGVNSLNSSWTQQLQENLCEVYKHVVAAGGSVQYLYQSSVYGVLADINVSQESCR